MMLKLKVKSEKLEVGFSLIEMLIAAMLFTFVIAGVTQLFTKATDLQRRASGYQKIQENAIYITESIAREVRVSEIQGTSGCSQTLTIEHPVNGTVVYSFATLAGRGIILRSNQTISSTDVNVTQFAFCVSGAGVDKQQARVTISMTLKAVNAKAVDLVSASLQTTIVSRDLTQELIP